MPANAATDTVSETGQTQSSKILPSLLAGIDETQKLSVLHIGPASSHTLDFFSQYRCRLHFVDVFAELPLQVSEDGPTDYISQWQQILQLPQNTCFDLCLFWDLFNFLSRDAIDALLRVLMPHLWEDSVGHAFSVHTPANTRGDFLYGVRDGATLSLRPRQSTPPGYAPHSQRQLTQALHCFAIERSVLLSDSRLELLLRVNVKAQN